MKRYDEIDFWRDKNGINKSWNERVSGWQRDLIHNDQSIQEIPFLEIKGIHQQEENSFR